MGQYYYFPIMVIGTLILMGVVFQILYSKHKEQKFKLLAMCTGFGCLAIELEISVFVRLPLYATIIVGLAGFALGFTGVLGFRKMSNSVRTKVGLMKESERQEEEEQIGKDLREMIGLERRNRKRKQT